MVKNTNTYILKFSTVLLIFFFTWLALSLLAFGEAIGLPIKATTAVEIMVMVQMMDVTS